MREWGVGAWEANWRSFRLFNVYRLLLSGAFLLALLFPNEWTLRLNLLPSRLNFLLVGILLLAALLGIALSRFWTHRFNTQLSLQVLIDILVISALMYFAGGVGSGLGLILLVTLAGASLVGRGRLVLFYAALATLAALLSQILGVLQRGFEVGGIVQAGFISAAYFATAILAWLLGRRVMLNEELARRRGEALDNQVRISQQVVEHMQDGVLIVSPEGRIVRCNPVAASLLGVQAASGALREWTDELAAGLKRWQAGEMGEGFTFSGASGRELAGRFESTASSDGEVLIFIEDMGRIKERARQLKLAALGRLTASIAHEIRNPLSAVSHASELLQEAARDEVDRRLLRIIRDNTARLNHIVGNVLELGRQTPARPESIDLMAFLELFVLNLQASEGLDDGVVIYKAIGAGEICFDRAHLHQVLTNLASNALRHATRRQAAVRIEARSAARPGWVELHVIDDGPGVPEAVREQIFEPFFTTHHQGTGLGLFIARELCAANGAVLDLLDRDAGGHFILSGRSDTCP